MGDLGRIDEKGLLWFYGRKDHRVVLPDLILFTIPAEAVFNWHPLVRRSALVGIPAETRGIREPVPLWELANELIAARGINPVEKRISRRKAMTMALILSYFHRLFLKSREPRLTPFLVHELTASHWFDISSAKTMLGYKPEVSINEGLEKLKSQSQ